MLATALIFMSFVFYVDSYFVGPNATNYSGATAYCQSQGSHLATITNDNDWDEARILCDAIDTPEDDISGCWIGLFYNDTTAIWQWVDGSALGYGFNGTNPNTKPDPPYPWWYGQPSGTNNNEHCIQLQGNRFYYWNDARCDGHNYPICNSLDPRANPTKSPSIEPTSIPSRSPLSTPTSNIDPSSAPTPQSQHPSIGPTLVPTGHPTLEPTWNPTTDPTDDLIKDLWILPTSQPTAEPTTEPTAAPFQEAIVAGVDNLESSTVIMMIILLCLLTCILVLSSSLITYSCLWRRDPDRKNGTKITQYEAKNVAKLNLKMQKVPSQSLKVAHSNNNRPIPLAIDIDIVKDRYNGLKQQDINNNEMESSESIYDEYHDTITHGNITSEGKLDANLGPTTDDSIESMYQNSRNVNIILDTPSKAYHIDDEIITTARPPTLMI